MEEGQNVHPENILMQGNRRNSMRVLAFQSAMQASENSLMSLILNIIYYIIKVCICAYVLLKYPESTEAPLSRFVSNSIISDLVFAYVLLRKLSQSSNELNAKMIYNVGYLFYFSNQVYGNYIYFSCTLCSSENSVLNSTSFWLLIMGYINLCLPFMLICCLLLCIHAAIVILGSAIPNAQRPATEEAMSRLVPVVYKPSDVESSDENCIICSEDYKAGDLVLYLNCGNNHKFHDLCLKTWIKINSVCPICRHPIE